jgi:hypothetical protein
MRLSISIHMQMHTARPDTAPSHLLAQGHPRGLECGRRRRLSAQVL